jgi:hypothetical protein
LMYSAKTGKAYLGKRHDDPLVRELT